MSPPYPLFQKGTTSLVGKGIVFLPYISGKLLFHVGIYVFFRIRHDM